MQQYSALQVLLTKLHGVTKFGQCKGCDWVWVPQGALELSAETEAAGEDIGRLPSDHLRALDYGGVATAAHGALMAREEDCELYVRLLCDFEPAAVLPFLQSHTSYRCTLGCFKFQDSTEGLWNHLS